MSYTFKTVIWSVAILSVLGFLHAHGTYLGSFEMAFVFGICFFCELVDSSLGMGYGTMLTPLLLFFGLTPEEIIPNLLLSELFTGLSAGFFHHQIQNVDMSLRGRHLKVALILMAGSLVGVFFGVHLVIALPQRDVVEIIGCIIISSGLFVLLFYNKVIVYRKWKIVVIALVASFNKSFSGGGYGPLITSGQILSGIKGKSSVAITSVSEGATCLFGVMIFYFNGVTINPSLAIPMTAGALLSVPFSALLVSYIPEGSIRLVVGAFTVLLGMITIYMVL